MKNKINPLNVLKPFLRQSGCGPSGRDWVPDSQTRATTDMFKIISFGAHTKISDTLTTAPGKCVSHDFFILEIALAAAGTWTPTQSPWRYRWLSAWWRWPRRRRPPPSWTSWERGSSRSSGRARRAAAAAAAGPARGTAASAPPPNFAARSRTSTYWPARRES